MGFVSIFVFSKEFVERTNTLAEEFVPNTKQKTKNRRKCQQPEDDSFKPMENSQHSKTLAMPTNNELQDRVEHNDQTEHPPTLGDNRQSETLAVATNNELQDRVQHDDQTEHPPTLGDDWQSETLAAAMNDELQDRVKHDDQALSSTDHPPTLAVARHSETLAAATNDELQDRVQHDDQALSSTDHPPTLAVARHSKPLAAASNNTQKETLYTPLKGDNKFDILPRQISIPKMSLSGLIESQSFNEKIFFPYMKLKVMGTAYIICCPVPNGSVKHIRTTHTITSTFVQKYGISRIQTKLLAEGFL
jgi:hypothetical protein